MNENKQRTQRSRESKKQILNMLRHLFHRKSKTRKNDAHCAQINQLFDSFHGLISSRSSLFILAILFFQCELFAADSLRNIGTVNSTNCIRWDGSGASFKIYLSDVFLTQSNGVTILQATNYLPVATVAENVWRGRDATNWTGLKAIFVESEYGQSERVAVTFRAGLPPANLRVSTNSP